MPYFKKSPTFQKLEQLVEELPAPVKWIMPDPYDPSSYMMPIGGMTKMVKGGGRLFDVIFKRGSTGRVLPTVPFEIASSAHPEKLRSFLASVEKQYPNAIHNQRVQFPKHLVEKVEGLKSPEERLLDAIFKGWEK